LSERFICIHGHFYQPPRENPWLDAVEMQDSAAPFHDWNERITAECYGPNASSRILDDHDRIVKIVNNYSSISYNFGPTLLSWMEVHAPETYRAIIGADARSAARFGGHGSSIAQPYNHMIMPLAGERDARTQVRWGMRDFEVRFGRRAQGMWLPETAVDVATLEALAAEQVAFTILEPHQARRYRLLGGLQWTDANGGIDATRPYLCRLPSGRSIAIFFYDGPISRAIAFERLLARGELFAHRLISAFSDAREHTQIVNVATDGETYGHHHRFGDMALAYALDYIDRNRLAQLTNYGQFLDLHPPTHEVEINELTSWSCAHGVERWRSDCGCSTGASAGWNQQWREPLREAFDWLREQLDPLYVELAQPLFSDPWAARDGYIDVILGRTDEVTDAFLLRHARRKLDDAEVTTALELLEMQRHGMLMYTSCGWFFNDVSGIETVQVLQYAGRAVQLAEKLSGRRLTDELMTRLEPARSNLPERGTARQIFEAEVLPSMVDLGRVCAHYAVASLFEIYRGSARVYSYDVEQFDDGTLRVGRARLVFGSISITSRLTRQSTLFAYAVLHIGDIDLTGGYREIGAIDEYFALRDQLRSELKMTDIPDSIRALDRHFGRLSMSIKSLFRDEQRKVLALVWDSTLSEAETAFRQLHDQYDPLMRLHAGLGVPLPPVLHLAAEVDLNMRLRRLLDQKDFPLGPVDDLLTDARNERVTLDASTLMSMKAAIERIADRLDHDPKDVDSIAQCQAAIALLQKFAVDVDLRRPQNLYYQMRQNVRTRFEAAAHDGSADARQWLRYFDALGETLSFNTAA
jgi:alpha-amylase/alpha-mannosidase (GH57 family)